MTSPARPAMVVLARESRGLSQTQLAKRLSISSAMMSRIESGVRPVSDAVLENLSRDLDYPVEFFSQADPIIGFGTGELFHRKRQDVPQRKLDQIHAWINIRRLHLKRLLLSVDLPPTKVPLFDIDDFSGRASEVARAVRATWQLPRGPIENLTTVVEDAGCFVIPFDFESRRIEAISQWPPDMPPLVFVNAASPSDRSRLTLAHELAHLVMHQQAPNPEMETQAFEFAAEFLMPEDEIRPYLRGLTLAKLATLKPYWRVSMAAILKRAGDLEEVTPRQARTLWMKLGQSGFRDREPANLDLSPEPASLFPELIGVFRRELGYSPEEFAKTVILNEREATETYYRDSFLRLVS